MISVAVSMALAAAALFSDLDLADHAGFKMTGDQAGKIKFTRAIEGPDDFL